MTDRHRHPHPAPQQLTRRSADRNFVSVDGSMMADRRHFDRQNNIHVIKVFSGDCFVTNEENHMLVTILGSCVSACIRDPIAKIGGMNHFLLPETHETQDKVNESNRYGAFAMEQLINEILKRGGMKNRLEVKVFGGGNVINNSAMIGDRNVQFVREFLQREGLRISGEHLGGKLPRRIHYYPDTGKVMLRALKRREDMLVVEEEKKFESSLHKKPIEGEIDLF